MKIERDILDELIVDLPVYLEKRTKELRKSVNDLVKQGIRVVRDGNTYVDVVYLEKGKRKSVKQKDVRDYAFKLARNIDYLKKQKEDFRNRRR